MDEREKQLWELFEHYKKEMDHLREIDLDMYYRYLGEIEEEIRRRLNENM